MLSLADKNIKAATNIQTIMETMFKELNKNMRTMAPQIGNLNKDKGTIKK